MRGKVNVWKDRKNILRIYLGMDVSGDIITSEIRTQANVSATLLAAWDVDFETDGTDGALVLTLESADVGDISVNIGYMDLKRVSGGDPFPIFEDPLEVVFKNSVTS